jgi:hypothetical protein
MKGFFRRRTRLANRFLVRWERVIENGIAPPQLLGWCCDRLEENIDAEK